MFVNTPEHLPVCKAVVDAPESISRHDKAYLRKRCREHGSFRPGVRGYLNVFGITAHKPGTTFAAVSDRVRDSCPSDCGLRTTSNTPAWVDRSQHTLQPGLPICFATGRQPDGYAITRRA